jgi:hypothetical protein
VDGSVLAVRLFDVVTRLLALPEDAGERMHAALNRSGLVQRLCDAVTGDDVLLQVNILHFVPRVAVSRSGAVQLLEAGTCKRAPCVCVYVCVGGCMRVCVQLWVGVGAWA